MTSYHKKTYGAWAGNPAGHPPDFTRCAEEVADRSTRWPHYHQCNRKRGHGPAGAFCRQHDPEAVKARRVERDRRDRERHEKDRVRWYGASFLRVLRQIADGHNDPRTLARDTIENFEKGRL